MTKRRQPDSAQDALNRSILELGVDPDHGDDRWNRAARVLGVTPRLLYGAADPAPSHGKRVPIRLEWLEWLDLIHVREGREPINQQAWKARHEAAAASIDLLPTTPEVRLQRALTEMSAALQDYEHGLGDPLTVQEQLTALVDLNAKLMRVWSRRERTQRDRRFDDGKEASKPRLVGER